MIGLQADLIAANRKLLQDIQYRVKNLEYGGQEIEKGQCDTAGRKLL